MLHFTHSVPTNAQKSPAAGETGPTFGLRIWEQKSFLVANRLKIVSGIWGKAGNSLLPALAF
jgi:hypothetical protein